MEISEETCEQFDIFFSISRESRVKNYVALWYKIYPLYDNIMFFRF